ncbi:arginine 2-monooxygenase [Streptomyces scopuliridis]
MEHGRALLDERLSSEVLEYLRSGVEAGMVVPDASGTEVKSVRVVRQS